MNTKLHTVCDGKGRPLIMLLSEGQMSNYKGAALMIDAFRKANLRRETLTANGQFFRWQSSDARHP